MTFTIENELEAALKPGYTIQDVHGPECGENYFVVEWSKGDDDDKIISARLNYRFCMDGLILKFPKKLRKILQNMETIDHLSEREELCCLDY